MKNNKHIQTFKQHQENLNISDVRSSKIDEKLSQSSIDDLINLKNELQFVMGFDIEIYEAIEVIEQLHKMNWEQIEEWREHIITNYSTTKVEDFVLRLIDRYCSNIEDDKH
jgi:hypothetical protein